LQNWQRYHEVLTQRIAAQQDVVAQAAQGVVEQRQQLLVARQETKVIEKLRDRVQRRALLDLTRREQQLFDELALTRSRHEP
jgi:flagellar export protein FliJ